MKIEHEVLELNTRRAFTIARAEAPPVRRNVWLRIRDEDGNEGWGEAAANAYYGESAETVIAVLPKYEAALRNAQVRDVLELETLERAVHGAAGYNPAASAAVSAALHDLVGKRAGLPVWRMWGLSPQSALSSYTLGIADAGEMREKLAEATSYPIIKLKVGTPEDRAMLDLVRRHAPEKTLRVDANTGWTLDDAVALLPMLEEYGVELIEQPFRADDLESFRALRGRSRIPIVADESCRVAADIPTLAGAVDGINIKLEKCGSLREAVRMVHVARAHDLRVMLGCMMSSTLAIAAAMQVAPLVDWTDLDAAALMAYDPFVGPQLHPDGRLELNEAPGLGVTQRKAVAP